MLNMKLDRDQVRIALHGEGGMKLHQLNEDESASKFFQELFAKADGCVLHIGDNDVYNHSPAYLAKEIISKAESLAEKYNIGIVYVARLPPRRSGARGNIGIYNQKPYEVNVHLGRRRSNSVVVLPTLFTFPCEHRAKYLYFILSPLFEVMCLLFVGL